MIYFAYSIIKARDKKIIHNPSAIDVWVEDNDIIKIKAGETVLRS